MPGTLYMNKNGTQQLNVLNGQAVFGTHWNSQDVYMYAAGGRDILLGGGIGGIQNDVIVGNGDLIVSNGDVGIGTTSPAAKLTVVDDILCTGSSPSLTLTDSTGSFVVATNTAAEGIIKTVADKNIRFFRNDSTETMRIAAVTGNVGIGTNNPARKLHVQGDNNNDPVVRIVRGNNTAQYLDIRGYQIQGRGNHLLLTADDTKEIWLGQESNNQRVVIDSSGKVGIGTTLPNAGVDITKTTRITGNANIPSSGAGIEINYSTQGEIYAYDRTASAYKVLRLRGSSILLDQGNVGIGTTSPAAKLDLNGTSILRGLVNITTSGEILRLNDTNSSGNPYMSFYQNGTRRSFIQHADTGDFLKLASEYGGISFFTGTAGTETQKMTILSGGNVGIGDTNPDAKLTVYRTDSTYAINLSNTEARAGLSVKSSSTFDSKLTISSGASSRQYIQAVNNAATTGRDIVLNPYGGNVGIGKTDPSEELDVNGDIRASGDVIAFSDIRVKENITTIENALDKVKKLRGVEYNKIDNPERSIGVIAQEIEEVIPEVVREDNEGMKSVAYGNITAVLIEAIKEQQKQIEELKNQLDAFTK